MEKLLKKPGETEQEYHKRLVYGKLVDKTLADEDYTELATFVYGKEYSSDVARRMMYGSRYTLELLDNAVQQKTITSTEVLNEIEAKKVELQKERQRFFDQRREYNKLINAEGRKEHLEDKLVEAADRLSESIGFLFGKNRDLVINGDNEAVLVFCDWHYGLETTNIWNTYSTEICKRRVRTVVDMAVERLLLHKCSVLHIAVLGDLFHGAIHTSSRVASEELVCEQLINASEVLAQAIGELSGYVDHTIVYTTYGNHARTIQKKDDSIHRDNMERIIPWWLKERFKNNDHIEIADDSEDEFIYMNVCDHGICATHGDLDNVRTSTRLLPALFQKKYGTDIECILLADKHHRESFEELGVDAMLCGALCGSDDYANGKRLYSTPEQLMLIVNKNIGVDAEYRIRCM